MTNDKQEKKPFHPCLGRKGSNFPWFHPNSAFSLSMAQAKQPADLLKENAL